MKLSRLQDADLVRFSQNKARKQRKLCHKVDLGAELNHCKGIYKLNLIVQFNFRGFFFSPAEVFDYALTAGTCPG